MNNLPNQFFYSKKEDRLNVLSHGIGFILSILGLVFLLKKGLQDFDITFILVWVIAIFGIIWKIFTVGKYNLVSTILYMFMGGLWLFFIDAFISEIPENALVWIYASCLTYLIGVFFYLADS